MLFRVTLGATKSLSGTFFRPPCILPRNILPKKSFGKHVKTPPQYVVGFLLFPVYIVIY